MNETVKRRLFLTRAGWGAAALLGGLPEIARGEEGWSDGATRPNILFILVDDLGWNDVGYHGSEIDTPHIDRLAREGVRFEQHYVMPTCSPTRTALMSGWYPSRYGVLSPTNERVFAPGTTTLASALRDSGYDTGIVGKWHLGSKPAWGPLQFGFNHSYGSLAGGVHPLLHRYKKGEYSRTWQRDDVFFGGGRSCNGPACRASGPLCEASSMPHWVSSSVVGNRLSMIQRIQGRYVSQTGSWLH